MMALLVGVLCRDGDLLTATGPLLAGQPASTQGTALVWPAGFTAEASEVDNSVHVYDPDGHMNLSTGDTFQVGGGVMWRQDLTHFPAGRNVFLMSGSPTRIQP
jgi:hypothetical protein